MPSIHPCNPKFRRSSSARVLGFVFTVGPWLVACDDSSSTPAESGDSTAVQGSAETGMSATGETTNGDTGETTDASGNASEGAQTMGDASSTGDADSGEASASEGVESETSGQDPLALGTACSADEECESAKCTEVRGMMGMSRMVCSECKDSDECQADGTGLACIYDRELGWARCGGGELGDPCREAEECSEGLHCAPLIGDRMVCSSCASDDHCEDEDAPLCSITGQLGMMGGSLARDCVAEGSLSSGAPCDADGSGDQACAGYCVEFEIMMGGDFRLAVCGECRPGEEGDCAEDQTCVEPSASMDGIVGSVCE